uniref:Putative transcription dna-dependent n=1 Tax=Lutzomyia longipalpis TaxID=7200 RepID=A0A7G3AYH9_LUTLO
MEICNMPQEIMEKIMDFLDMRDNVNLSSTSEGNLFTKNVKSENSSCVSPHVKRLFDAKVVSSDLPSRMELLFVVVALFANIFPPSASEWIKISIEPERKTSTESATLLSKSHFLQETLIAKQSSDDGGTRSNKWKKTESSPAWITKKSHPIGVSWINPPTKAAEVATEQPTKSPEITTVGTTEPPSTESATKAKPLMEKQKQDRGFSFSGLISFLKSIQESFMSRTKRSIEDKIKFLTDIRDKFLVEIEKRISFLWPPNDATPHRKSKRHIGGGSEGHMDFPSAEGAFMTICFLTFAVFLIKLVLRTKSKIESVAVLRKNDNNPILAKFQNGDLLPGSHDNLECHFAVDKAEKKGHKLLTACDASVYIGDVKQDPQLNTFIAIRNTVTGKIRLVQVETCSMLSEHVLRVREDSAARTANDDSNKLYTQFGGKKAMKAHDKYNRMKVNVDIVKDTLDNTLEKHEASRVDEPEEMPDFRDTKRNPICPPMNKEAKNIKDLYSFTELIAPRILTEIEYVAKEVLKTPPDELPIESNFILQRIRKIQQSNNPESPENLLKTKALIYLDALMTLVKKVKKGQNFSSVSLSGICDNVETEIRKRFTDPTATRPIKSAFTTRKAICHILVLGILLTDTMEISVEEMTVELKTTNRKELLEFAIYLGLKISPNKEFLGLKLPSQMDDKRRLKPEMRRRRK